MDFLPFWWMACSRPFVPPCITCEIWGIFSLYTLWVWSSGSWLTVWAPQVWGAMWWVWVKMNERSDWVTWVMTVEWWWGLLQQYVLLLYQNLGLQTDGLINKVCLWDSPLFLLSPLFPSPWTLPSLHAWPAIRFLPILASLNTLLRSITLDAVLCMQHPNPNLCLDLPLMCKYYWHQQQIQHWQATLVGLLAANIPQDMTGPLLICQHSCCWILSTQ